jgi:hypothetical protein
MGMLRAFGAPEVDEKTTGELKRVFSATIGRLLASKKSEWFAKGPRSMTHRPAIPGGI